MPMGVLTPLYAHMQHSARPTIDISGIFPAHMSAKSHPNNIPSPKEGKVSEP